MHCSHGHLHYHPHDHPGVAEGLSQGHVNRLRMALILSAAYMLVQFLGGYVSGSLALMAEAGHKMGDMCVLGMALGAAWLALLPANVRKTFGYGRIEIFAALANSFLLIGVAIVILTEAYERFTGHHHDVEGRIMMLVSLIGLAINLMSARILRPAINTNLNIKGAFFHVMADLWASGGTLVSALLIMYLKLTWLDTLLSAAIASLVIFNALRLLKEALHVFLEAAPHHLNPETLNQFLQGFPGVREVHDLHLWTITTGKEALLTHVVVDPEHFHPETLNNLETALRDKFQLCHITIQLEPVGFEEHALPF